MPVDHHTTHRAMPGLHAAPQLHVKIMNRIPRIVTYILKIVALLGGLFGLFQIYLGLYFVAYTAGSMVWDVVLAALFFVLGGGLVATACLTLFRFGPQAIKIICFWAAFFLLSYLSQSFEPLVDKVRQSPILNLDLAIELLPVIIAFSLYKLSVVILLNITETRTGS